MTNILLVSESMSFLVSSLKKQLEELEYNVFYTNGGQDAFINNKKRVQLIIIYMDDKLSVNNLLFIKDKAIEDNIPIFVIGELGQIETFSSAISEQFIKKAFYPPINVKDVVSSINTYMLEDDSVTKKKILVVDDSGAVLRSVKSWLEGKYQVILANSGVMAIKYLTMNKPDLVLLDYEMPICDGSQVLEMIRSDSDFSNVPVIFLTSKNDRESVLKVTSMKPDGYLLKTMSPNEIIKSIDDFFEKQRLAKL